MYDKPFMSLPLEECTRFIERIIGACKWLRLMGDSEYVMTNEGQLICPIWGIPSTKYTVLVYGKWVKDSVCRFIVLNGESGAATAVSWIFHNERQVGVINVPDDVSEIVDALTCLDIMKSHRYQEIEGLVRV